MIRSHRISNRCNELRFTISLAAIFILNVLILSLDTRRQFPEPIGFMEWPLLLNGIGIGAIWVGVGRPHVLFRLSAYLLVLMVLFFLSAIAWFDHPWPWHPILWIVFLGDLSTPFLIAGVLLLPAVSVPLLLWRILIPSGQSRLSIAQLLSATTCFALTMAIAVTWFPSTDWLLILLSRLREFLADPSVLKVYVSPAILASLVVYMAFVCLICFRGRYAWILAAALAATFLMNFLFLTLSKSASVGFEISMFAKLYTGGQNLVSILATYFLLDFVFTHDNNGSVFHCVVEQDGILDAGAKRAGNIQLKSVE